LECIYGIRCYQSSTFAILTHNNNRSLEIMIIRKLAEKSGGKEEVDMSPVKFIVLRNLSLKELIRYV